MIKLPTAARLIVIALVLVLAGCSREDETEKTGENAPGPQPVAVRVERPRITTLERRISYVGTIFARQEVPIIARVQGTLAELPFREGDVFPVDSVLARLDSPELEAAVERLEAEVDYWNRRHETDKRLVAQGALAPEQADASERASRSARASLDEAKAQIAKTMVTAPFGGTVLDWPAEIGQPVMPGQPLILIGDSSREIKVEVVEEDLGRGISLGTPVELLVSPGTAVAARVSAIASISSGQARTFSVTIPIPDESSTAGLLRKGSSIRTEFIVDRQVEVVAVPTRAVADRDGRPHIFVISGETAHRVEVEPGITQEGWVAADFEWNGKDPVAVTNLSGLQNGAPVYAVSTEGSE